MKKTSSFLTGFLAMLVAAGLLSSAGTSQAALISINIGPTGFNIGGINGGAPAGNYSQAANFPISGNDLFLFNNAFNIFTGLQGGNGLKFATGASDATPVKFALNASIGSGSNYTADAESFFKYSTLSSPDFGAGSYMGFKTSQGNYGWLEVTWTAASNQFQIFSGAYESTPNVAILAGAGPSAAVPEPGTWAAAALLAGGAAFMRWRKRAKVA
jgi:hypothetical protein